MRIFGFSPCIVFCCKYTPEYANLVGFSPSRKKRMCLATNAVGGTKINKICTFKDIFATKNNTRTKTKNSHTYGDQNVI
jgi:hypothetical protein